jgi:Domain of unknown function (DUF4440)
VISGLSHEQSVLAVDARIDALASDGDFDALEELLAQDFRYNHSTGLSQSKTEWIEGLKPLVGRRRRVVSGLQIDPHGDVAVVMGDLDVVWNDGRIALDRYVRVYRLIEREWLAIFQRTLPAPDRTRPHASNQREAAP